MNRNKIIALLLVILIIVTGAIGYSVWNRPFSDPLEGKAIKVSAIQLFNDFSTNEIAAQQKYVAKNPRDKVLEITGEIKEKGKNTDGQTYYTLKTNDEMFGVKCVMDKSIDPSDALTGANITVRGFCDGYNLDVIVSRCKSIP